MSATNLWVKVVEESRSCYLIKSHQDVGGLTVGTDSSHIERQMSSSSMRHQVSADWYQVGCGVSQLLPVSAGRRFGPRKLYR